MTRVAIRGQAVAPAWCMLEPTGPTLAAPEWSFRAEAEILSAVEAWATVHQLGTVSGRLPSLRATDGERSISETSVIFGEG